jgi:hypothetical protein
MASQPASAACREIAEGDGAMIDQLDDIRASAFLLTPADQFWIATVIAENIGHTVSKLGDVERMRLDHENLVSIKRGIEKRLRIALGGLQQAYNVCRDNEPETCDARMALAFVCEVVGSAFDAATADAKEMRREPK